MGRILKGRRPSPAMIISVIALIVAVGGSTFAIAASDNKKDKKIANKVVTKRAPSLSVLHAKTADSATNAAKAADADKLGGSAASSFQNRVQWAHIAADGTVLEQSGGISTSNVGGGNYTVDFGSSLVNKAIVVSFQNDGFLKGSLGAGRCGGGTGATTCNPGVDDVNHALVYTANGGNTVAPEPFYITVTP